MRRAKQGPWQIRAAERQGEQELGKTEVSNLKHSALFSGLCLIRGKGWRIRIHKKEGKKKGDIRESIFFPVNANWPICILKKPLRCFPYRHGSMGVPPRGRLWTNGACSAVGRSRLSSCQQRLNPSATNSPCAADAGNLAHIETQKQTPKRVPGAKPPSRSHPGKLWVCGDHAYHASVNRWVRQAAVGRQPCVASRWNFFKTSCLPFIITGHDEYSRLWRQKHCFLQWAMTMGPYANLLQASCLWIIK